MYIVNTVFYNCEEFFKTSCIYYVYVRIYPYIFSYVLMYYIYLCIWDGPNDWKKKKKK